MFVIYLLLLIILYALRTYSRIQNTQKAIHSHVWVPMMLSTFGRAPLNTIHSSGDALIIIVNFKKLLEFNWRHSLYITLRGNVTLFQILLQKKLPQKANFKCILFRKRSNSKFNDLLESQKLDPAKPLKSKTAILQNWIPANYRKSLN